MKADLLITGISQLVTAKGRGARHGAAMRELEVVEGASLAITGGLIAWTGKSCEWAGHASETVDLEGRAVVPALIDPHTHAVWAGDRLADFDARTSGKSYEEILKAGGGIRSSIRATASATQEELVRLAAPRMARLLRSGATTIEVKSGYGFEPYAEIAMLEAIQVLRASTPARILSTLLIHIPPAHVQDRTSYIADVCNLLIPEVANKKLAVALDIFVEQEAWHVDEAEVMLHCARQHGMAIKLHSEQFQRVGGLELGIHMGALSVDHLEACVPEQFELLAASSTIATILPGVSLHLGIAAAPGRQLIDAGAAVAVGTDLNPGSSPLFSAAAALALAVRLNGLTTEEALMAGTVNAACAVGLIDAGRIEAGLEADFLVLEGRDWRELIYILGANPVREVWIHGEKVEQ
ncbi:imidazolonepropionase [Granulicella arctica]|uniref:Imidazolonepropionase n=1 Tax=Granulicella arctica TaxID=940613 RepID=A0A7Y9TTL0_9BACT|nr:imidazolonepropionase [Granulicella arctica]NYF80068.1 imidazolonepropionase [Granulicella arctica]